MNADIEARRTWVAGVVLLALAGGAGGQSWSRPGFKYRRTVTIENYKPTGLPGHDVAVLDMPTAGGIQPDGRDIRVVAGAGRDVPHRVLMVGPGDTVRLAFALYKTVPAYNVYFGNPKAPVPAKPLDIQRGVLLESWQYPGGPASKLSQAKRVLERANKLIGRGFRPTVFQSYNPFGPQTRLASVFTGWLVAPATGRYTFAASSQNASFLLVDDKPVVNNGGWHRPVRDIRRRGTIELTKGLHKLTYYHVTAAGNPVCVAAWQAPGDKRVWVIPSKAFAPVFRAVPAAMREYGKALNIDFLPEHANECFMMNRYSQRFTFKALSSGRGAARATWTWDFGDGQRAEGASVEHVYLLSGTYAVTLTCKPPGLAEQKRTHRIYVNRPWDKVTSRTLDTVRHHANIVSTYDFTKLDPQATLWAMHMLQRAQKTTSILRAGQEFCTLPEAPAAAVSGVMPIYADALVAKGDNIKAVGSLQKAAGMTRNPAVAAEMLVKAGQIYLLDRQRTKEALGLFQKVIQRYSALTRSDAIRNARMGIGDVYRIQGDLAKARAAYQQAHPGARVIGVRTPIVKGDFARHVEDYIRQRDYESAWDYLHRWERTFPLDKLEGYWSTLRVRLLRAERKYRAAIDEAEILVKVNPGSQYAAELLQAAADVYLKLGEKARHLQTLRQIVEKYPESPLALEAAKTLRGAK